jgi:predicted TIM-barrel fold metal-dependent hydrolase
MQKIIDIHSHLGDILYGKDIILKKGAAVPPSRAEEIYCANFKLALSRFINTNSRLFELLLNEKTAQAAVKAHIPRNNACTLENIGKTMDANGVSAMCVLPVHPYVTFEDVLKASNKDNRIIPFTSIDYSLGKDAGKKLLEDAANGARGLKLHPVIQKRSLLDDETLEALKHWEKTGRPVQPHLGEYYYYPLEDADRQIPEYGRYDEFKELLLRFPDIPFIASHSAGYDWKRLIRDGMKNDNLYLELSFSSRVQLKTYIKKWPADRILYGSDWPWGNPDITLKVIELSVKDPGVKEKILFKNAERLLKL